MVILTNSDGGARGNPGPGAIGVIVRKEGTILVRYSQMVGNQVTNNIAEYEGLIKALELTQEIGDKEVECNLDSELVVKQLLGEYRVRDSKLVPLFLKVQQLIDKFDKVKFNHVSREDPYQQLADELLNDELAKHGYKKKGK